MMNSLNIGLSGLEQFQQEIEVIGNNVANVNTTGYKGARMTFADTFSQTLGASGAAAEQVGSGVKTGAITNLWTQGTIVSTQAPSDLAVKGNGFFVVRDALSNAQYVTRAGDFQVDQSGRLITPDGMFLQGYNDAGLGTIGDLTVDRTGAPASAAQTATVSSFSVDKQGRITVKLSDNTEFVRGQVLLQSVTNPQALVKEGDNLYSGLANAGPLAAPSAPGQNGLGEIQGSALEQSNVDLATELTGLISTQRAFQANSRLITTTDEVLQEVVNLKR